jgi:hypothetical protein
MDHYFFVLTADFVPGVHKFYWPTFLSSRLPNRGINLWYESRHVVCLAENVVVDGRIALDE